MIISNTTPLINFSAIQRLDILESLFGEIIIPSQVWVELADKTTKYPSVAQFQHTSFVHIESIDDQLMLQTLKTNLDDGEAAAIVLALQQKTPPLLLLDELAGRQIAKRYGLAVIGSIGCLIQAKRNGIIPTIKPLLDAFQQDAGFWVNKKLYKQILFDNGELSENIE